MRFDSKDNLLSFLRNFEEIGSGSQGTCYYDPIKKQVYKIYNQYLDDLDEYYIDYTKDNIMRFSSIKNNTFIWANDTIYIGNEVVGYISKYVNAKSLYKTNPLDVNLNLFFKAVESTRSDIITISNNGVELYDVVYNLLYGRKIYTTDYDEYGQTDIDSIKLRKKNMIRFDYEIYLFLVDCYFNELIRTNKILSDLYRGKDEDVLEFIKEFRKFLNELVGKDIVRLSEAKQYINKNKTKRYYERNLFYM